MKDLTTTFYSAVVMTFAVWLSSVQGGSGQSIVPAIAMSRYVEIFNKNDHTTFGQTISNDAAAEWMAENVPRFECPDKAIEEIYHFRWWTFRKHIKQTPDGFVVTEFLPNVRWAGKQNTINCPAGHHFREGRWILNKQYLNDYSSFWFRKGGSPRAYSFWAADSIYQRALVLGNYTLAVELLPDLVKNYQSWESAKLCPDGLFWQIDDRDGMEVSIGQSGKRATINSYMYGDARAIAAIARVAGNSDLEKEYTLKADKLRKLVQEKLWNANDQFFETRSRSDSEMKNPPGYGDGTLSNVRELHGFTPWYFDLPESGKGYEIAWKQLIDSKGFKAPFGPTTAEQRHPKFTISYEGHECQWNGPSWPFSTAITLTALANVLNDYSQKDVTREDYFETLKAYTNSQHLKRDDGTLVPWIDENLNPFTGDWIARTRMKNNPKGPWNGNPTERGKDYNHSTYCDLIITGLIGLRPQAGDKVIINPLLPEGTWDYFCLDRIPYHGRLLTVLFDRTGEKYGKGTGLRVLADGIEIGFSPKLQRLEMVLPK